jgi:hypothetical protein
MFGRCEVLIARDLRVGVRLQEIASPVLVQAIVEARTDNAKWNPAYQKKIGLKSGPAKLDARTAKDLERLSKRICRLLSLSGYVAMTGAPLGKLPIVNSQGGSAFSCPLPYTPT